MDRYPSDDDIRQTEATKCCLCELCHQVSPTFPYYYSASNYVSKWVSKGFGNQSKLSFFCQQLPRLQAEQNTNTYRLFVNITHNGMKEWSVKSIFICFASFAYLHAVKLVVRPITSIVLSKAIRMFDVNHSSWMNAKTFFSPHRKNCHALLFTFLCRTISRICHSIDCFVLHAHKRDAPPALIVVLIKNCGKSLSSSQSNTTATQRGRLTIR